MYARPLPAQESSTDNPEKTSWRLIAVGFIAGCAVSFHTGKISAALPVLSDDLSLSLVAGSSLVALFSIVIASCGFFGGLIASVAGAGRTLQAGLLCSGMGSIVGGLSESLLWLQIGRAVEGIGWLLIAVAVPSIFGLVAAARDKSLVLGIWGAFVPAGMTIALLVSPAVLMTWNWQTLWLVSGGFSLLWLLVVRHVFKTTVFPRSPLASSRFLLASVSTSPPWLMAGCFMIYSAQFVMLTAFLPTLLLDRYSISLSDAAVLGALVVVANGFGNVMSGVLMRRGWRVAHLLLLAALFMGSSIAFVFYGVGGLAFAVAAAVVAAATGGTIPGSLFAAAPGVSRDPRFVACVVGLMLQFAGIGQLLGPLALGHIVEGAGAWAGVAGLNLFLAMVGIICALLLFRTLPAVE